MLTSRRTVIPSHGRHSFRSLGTLEDALGGSQKHVQTLTLTSRFVKVSEHSLHLIRVYF